MPFRCVSPSMRVTGKWSLYLRMPLDSLSVHVCLWSDPLTHVCHSVLSSHPCMPLLWRAVAHAWCCSCMPLLMCPAAACHSPPASSCDVTRQGATKCRRSCARQQLPRDAGSARAAPLVSTRSAPRMPRSQPGYMCGHDVRGGRERRAGAEGMRGRKCDRGPQLAKQHTI
eukprot:360527-Chlamydomonas_euryale.AAC.4